MHSLSYVCKLLFSNVYLWCRRRRKRQEIWKMQAVFLVSVTSKSITLRSRTQRYLSLRKVNSVPLMLITSARKHTFTKRHQLNGHSRLTSSIVLFMGIIPSWTQFYSFSLPQCAGCAGCTFLKYQLPNAVICLLVSRTGKMFYLFSINADILTFADFRDEF